ncbi:hypothetical protein N7466_001599 [Penicillium verhagenii]|uniref:uncharacterized protein n=1 Tax=Penicillium verhagenii TaxID=1562060 RepID=UPI0025452ED4|nr:uncharacterized protein N7466_001599 [Penicillium verhagenii]KAJ5938465.1 hypothetical protein N7466_001599 [Penicillium verhagenii]
MVPTSQSELADLERKLFSYHQSHFQLSARVHLSHLTFEKGFRAWMDDRDNVQRLKKTLEIQGCRRLMRDNHVPVVVSRSDWERRVSPRYGNGIMPSLNVDLDYRLRALDHENLITAARKKLEPEDQWWIVDVYVTDDEEGQDLDRDLLQEKFVQSLKERYPNDNRPPDGLIYERINYYEGYLDGPKDQLAANNWWVILQAVAGSKKGGYLRRFFKNAALHRKLNSLLVIRGLWEGMRIGLLHKVTAMHCDEPMICYWDLIFQTFLTLVGGRTDLLPLIDGVTVGLIQARSPKLSANDLQFLQLQMNEGTLFAEFEEDHRKDIWERLKKIDYPIPTLKTFFKDRIYLEVAQSVMKRLFIQPRDEIFTIDTGVYSIFDTAIPISLRKERLRSDLLEFWRFSFQYGFELTDHQRRKCLGSPDNEHTPDQDTDQAFPFHRSAMWQHFCGILRARGFLPPGSMTQSSPVIELPPLVPCDYPEDPSQEIDVAKRCGKPFANTRQADWFALLAESLQQPETATRVSAVFLRRWVFKAFFGYLMDRGGSGTFVHRGFEADPAVRDDHANTAEGHHHPTALTAPHTTAEAPSNLPTSSSAPVADSFAPMISASAGSLLIGYIMHVKIQEIRETLYLPIDPSFMTEFCNGLAQHNFEVFVLEPAPGTSSEFLLGRVSDMPRYIYPQHIFTHYLDYPASELHAQFNAETAFVDAGRKRRRIDGREEMEQEMMEEAKTWLEEEKAKIHRRNRPQTIDLEFSV